jgi:hypothetical protein
MIPTSVSALVYMIDAAREFPVSVLRRIHCIARETSSRSVAYDGGISMTAVAP